MPKPERAKGCSDEQPDFDQSATPGPAHHWDMPVHPGKTPLTLRLLQRFDFGALFGIGHASRGRSAPGPLIDALCRAPLPAEALRIQAREQEVRFRLAPSPHATRRTEISVWLNVENCQVFVVRFDRPVDDPCAPPTQQTMSLKKIRAQLEQHIRIQCRHHGWQQVDGR